MIGKLFRALNRNRPERPSFRPVLESLENRVVPSAADASAAFDALPTDVSNLVASMQARPTDRNAISANLAQVNSDIVLLEFSARNFVVPDRLQIDNALVTNGIILFFQGFNNFPHFPSDEFVSVLRLGASAVQSGAVDSLITGFFPQTSNDAVLT